MTSLSVSTLLLPPPLTTSSSSSATAPSAYASTPTPPDSDPSASSSPDLLVGKKLLAAAVIKSISSTNCDPGSTSSSSSDHDDDAVAEDEAEDDYDDSNGTFLQQKTRTHSSPSFSSGQLDKKMSGLSLLYADTAPSATWKPQMDPWMKRHHSTQMKDIARSASPPPVYSSLESHWSISITKTRQALELDAIKVQSESILANYKNTALLLANDLAAATASAAAALDQHHAPSGKTSGKRASPDSNTLSSQDSTELGGGAGGAGDLHNTLRSASDLPMPHQHQQPHKKFHHRYYYNNASNESALLEDDEDDEVFGFDADNNSNSHLPQQQQFALQQQSKSLSSAPSRRKNTDAAHQKPSSNNNHHSRRLSSSLSSIASAGAAVISKPRAKSSNSVLGAIPAGKAAPRRRSSSAARDALVGIRDSTKPYKLANGAYDYNTGMPPPPPPPSSGHLGAPGNSFIVSNSPRSTSSSPNLIPNASSQVILPPPGYPVAMSPAEQHNFMAHPAKAFDLHNPHDHHQYQNNNNRRASTAGMPGAGHRQQLPTSSTAAAAVSGTPQSVPYQPPSPPTSPNSFATKKHLNTATTTTNQRGYTNIPAGQTLVFHSKRRCISCGSDQSPCWRPSWSPSAGQLCNSCGLRYKKTNARCLNKSCGRIPAKCEWASIKNDAVKDADGKIHYRCTSCKGEIEVKKV